MSWTFRNDGNAAMTLAFGTLNAPFSQNANACVSTSGAYQAGFGYLFNECAHTRMCGSGSTSVRVTGNSVVGDLAHVEIQISSGYDFVVLEARPGSTGRLVGTSNGPNWGSAFSYELVPPAGETTASIGLRLQTAATLYNNDLWYSVPSPQYSFGRVMDYGYNSNSYVGGLIERVLPGSGVRWGISSAAQASGFRVPGMEKPIPLGGPRYALSVRQAFHAERASLLALPAHDFPIGERVAVTVGKTPYARFDLNDYSVPHTHVGRTLSVLADEQRVRILEGTQELACHARSWDRGAQIEDASHVQALVDHKRGAHAHRACDRLAQAAPASAELLKRAGESTCACSPGRVRRRK